MRLCSIKGFLRKILLKLNFPDTRRQIYCEVDQTQATKSLSFAEAYQGLRGPQTMCLCGHMLVTDLQKTIF